MDRKTWKKQSWGLTLLVMAGTSALAFGNDDLSPATKKELAAARSATAKYHDIAQAEADGYTNTGVYIPGEGLHYANFSLFDTTFDPERPEALIYAPVAGEDRLELVAVEYLVPLALSANAPAGFTGNADVWKQDEEGFGLWEMRAWIWMHNPNGMFAETNPRVP